MRMKVNGNSKNNITGYAKRNRNILIFILLSYVLNVGFLITGTQIQLPLYKQKLRSLEVGQVADFQVKAENEVFYIDDEKTEELRELQASNILPVYTIEETKVLNLISHFERFASFYLQEGQDMPLQQLNEELSLRFPNRFGIRDIEILANTEELYRALPLIEEKLHEKYTQKNIITEDEIESVAQQKFAAYNVQPATKAAAVMLLVNFAEQTAYYNATLTSALKKQARQQVQPITYHIQKGELLISEGDIISQEDMHKVEALLEKRPMPDMQESTAIILYIAGIFFLAIIMYKPLLKRSRRFYQHTYILLIASIVFSFNIFLVLTFSLVPPGLPVSVGIFTALISMLIATLISQRVGIISSLLLSLIFFAIPDIDIYTFIFSFLAGITATYLIRNAEKRIDLVAGTLQLALVVVLITVIIGLFQQKDISWYLKAGGVGIIHAFITGALNLALLPAFEHLLNAPTV